MFASIWKYLAVSFAGVLAIVGAFFFGFHKGTSLQTAVDAAKFNAYVAQAEKTATDLKQKNTNISNQVVTQYVDRVNTVKEKEYVYVNQATTDVPTQHVLSNGWVYLHDISTTNGDADSTKSSDATPSTIKDNQALAVVVSNYADCNANAEQLKNLQQWINDNIKAINASNKEQTK